MSQDRYTRSARDKPCQIRLPGYCTGGGPDTVPCHLNGAGWALKALSIHIAYGCRVCHDIVDGRMKCDIPKDDRDRWHLEGVIRTQIILVKTGILKL